MAMAAGLAIFAVVVASLLVSLAAAHEPPKFGYSGSNGPDKWGSLSPDYHLCSSSKYQSPVDIVRDDSVYNSSMKSLDRDYDPINATLVNNGFNVELRFDGAAGTLSIDGKNYTLNQVHWHSPSEHTIDGERYPIELHLVHKSDDGNITVVAILFKYGHPDPFLVQLKDALVELAKDACSEDEEAQIPAGEVDTKSLRRHTRKYYRYVGSLTAPPCTENVIWNVLGKVRSISKEQVAALQAPLEMDYRNNSRPIQPLNGRTVALYDEGHRD